MTAYRKEWVLGILFVIIVVLHTDWWWWNVREPFLFGVLPFTMTWASIIDLLVLGIFLWWISWGWPAPPPEYDEGAPLVKTDEEV